jgi:hypothetical protein
LPPFSVPASGAATGNAICGGFGKYSGGMVGLGYLGEGKMSFVLGSGIGTKVGTCSYYEASRKDWGRMDRLYLFTIFLTNCRNKREATLGEHPAILILKEDISPRLSGEECTV